MTERQMLLARRTSKRAGVVRIASTIAEAMNRLVNTVEAGRTPPRTPLHHEAMELNTLCGELGILEEALVSLPGER